MMFDFYFSKCVWKSVPKAFLWEESVPLGNGWRLVYHREKRKKVGLATDAQMKVANF